ncbi:MAG TPA: 30S ribosomal protein S6 [Bryobacteraceae bacterium]|jgi:small subunit ribosomal protein S6|nr:30S ribosomal protein S6 [Bryobacteraceae bacterium]
MRIYEELFITRPDLTDAEIDPLVEQLTQIVTSSGGTVDKTEKWGVRKLAYRVLKYNEGYYVLLQFTAGPQTVREIERRLRVSDLVIKFLTVRIDEKLKKIAKRKKSRDKRAARRPAPPVHAAPAPPEGAAPAAPAMPGAPAAPEKPAEPAKEAAPVAAEPVKEQV